MRINVYEIRTEMPDMENGKTYDRFTVHAADFDHAVTKAKKSKNMFGEERIAEVILLARGDE